MPPKSIPLRESLSSDSVLSLDPGSNLGLTNTQGTSFRFVSITDPEEAKDRELRRSVRSHAVKQALRNRRQGQSSENQNFRSSTLERMRFDRSRYRMKGTQTLQDASPPLSTFGVLSDLAIPDSDARAKLVVLLRSGPEKYLLSQRTVLIMPKTKRKLHWSRSSATLTMSNSKTFVQFSGPAWATARCSMLSCSQLR
jgi:hypothetical protein